MSRKCYLCGSEKSETISGRLRYGEARSVVKCAGCKLVFIDPPMTKKEEEVFYQEEYGKIFAREKDTTPEKLFNIRNPEALAYYDMVRPYLRKEDRCLELGCASGYFLNYIKDKVASIAGYEPFTAFRRYCESLGISMLDDLTKCGSGSYDKIFMFFLLEHLTDPVPYLKNLNRLLRRDGALLMVIPNVDDALLTVYNIPALKDFYFNIAHPFYYSKTTLSSLLEKSGFTDYDIRPAQRYDLSNHINWMIVGSPGGQGRYNDLLSDATRRSYAEDLKRQFRCDTIFVVVRKADG